MALTLKSIKFYSEKKGLIGVLGIISNQRNIFIVLMCIELILLSINLNFILFSVYLDDSYGQLF